MGRDDVIQTVHKAIVNGCSEYLNDNCVRSALLLH